MLDDVMDRDHAPGWFSRAADRASRMVRATSVARSAAGRSPMISGT